jgi:hypothetical protein
MNQSALRKTVLSALILAAILCMNACSACTGANLEGMYTDSSGAFKLELKSGGKATLTTMNSPTACTYKADGKQLTVVCENQTLAFTIQNDGSLMPPAEAGIGPLKKAKP